MRLTDAVIGIESRGSFDFDWRTAAAFLGLTRQRVDEEIKRIVGDAHGRTVRLLSENRHRLETLAEDLFRAETLDVPDAYVAAGIDWPAGRAMEREESARRRPRRRRLKVPGAVAGDGAVDHAEIVTVSPPERSPGTQSRRDWAPAGPLRHPVLFVNPASGGGRARRAGVAERARDRGIEVIVLGPDHSLTALVRDAVARGADALGVAGGDGSLAIVAAAAQANGLPFVCIPAGTRNHFALDLGVDRHDLVGALDGFTDGVERRIDVAQVNGRVFLNNVSLGIYGDAVRQPGYRYEKVRTLLETAQTVLGPSGAAPELHLVDDLGREHSHPAMVLVSNNPYALDLPVAPGTRPTLSGGRLGIVVLDPPRCLERDRMSRSMPPGQSTPGLTARPST